MNNEIILTLVLILGTAISLRISDYFLTKMGSIKKVSEKRIYYISKSISLLLIIVAFLLLAIIWSVSFDGALIFASSVFTVVGVALFAQWSILSNLTASIIIFFSFPARVGDTITIIDGENTLTGTIIEISIFTIELLDKDGETVMYPSNLFIQKPIKKLKVAKG